MAQQRKKIRVDSSDLYEVLCIVAGMALALSTISGCRLIGSADACWNFESSQAMDNYDKYKTRSEILHATESTTREVASVSSNQIMIIESDPNGCSLGSNGQTIVKIYFDKTDRVRKIQVYRNFIAGEPGYQMELIDEKAY